MLMIAWVAQALLITWEKTRVIRDCPGGKLLIQADLFGKEYFVKSTVLDHCPTDFFIWDPFEKEDESVNRPNRERKH